MRNYRLDAAGVLIDGAGIRPRTRRRARRGTAGRRRLGSPARGSGVGDRYGHVVHPASLHPLQLLNDPSASAPQRPASQSSPTQITSWCSPGRLINAPRGEQGRASQLKGFLARAKPHLWRYLIPLVWDLPPAYKFGPPYLLLQGRAWQLEWAA